MTEPTEPAIVYRISLEAKDIISLNLRLANGGVLPHVDPGAHIDLFLPNGLARSYSLSNMPEERGTYRITVARDAASQGGSVYLHDSVRVGDTIDISAQRNNFELIADAPFSVFIAGGIGITPFIPMIARLNEAGRPWRLHYCARTRDRAALLEDLDRLACAGGGEVLHNYDEEPGGAMLDLSAVLAGLPAGGHVYCCGPAGMLDAFRAASAAAGIEEERTHFEYFSANVEKADQGGFTVVCERSGKNVRVRQGQTILKALAEVGVDVPFSCESGVCGSCETRVLSGEPDHRDMILSAREREEGRKIIICCSGSKSGTLVLDC